MTRDETKRLTVVEVDVKYLRQSMDALSETVGRIHDTMMQQHGEDNARSRFSTRAHGWMMFFSSLCSGGLGAVLAKKFG